MNEMMTHPPATGNHPDDIDLLRLVEKGQRYFQRFGRLYLFALIAGIGLGLALFFILPKIYKSEMILHSSFLTNPEQIQIIDNWGELLKRHEYRALTEIFHTSPGITKKLTDIDGLEIQKVFTPNNPNGFYIDVKVKDNSILPELQQGIVFALGNTEYIRERVASKKANLTELLVKVKTELTKLDSTKTTVQNIITSREKNSSSIMLDVSGIDRQWIELNEKLLFYQDELKFSNAVQVLQGFSPLDTPVSPGWKLLIVLGVITGFVITYLYTLTRYVRDRLKTRS
jgi:prefoldin subunit 5